MVPNAERRIFDQHCGTRRIVELLSPKWRILILCALGDGTHRYNELLGRLDGVSPKMLTQSLRGMERDGLIERSCGSSSSTKVEYAHTILGRTVHDQLRSLCDWAELHLEELG